MNHRWVARLLVVALHAALLAALWLHRSPRPPEASERRLISLRIVVPPKPREPPPTPKPPPRTTLPRPSPSTAPPPDVATPVTATEPAPPAATPAPPAEPQPAEAPRTALRLTLPPSFAASAPPSMLGQALNDRRTNTPKPTVESRIADAAAATGPWISERTSDHRTLLRRGDTCVEMFRSRIADMDPFNGNVAPRTVPMFGKPYKCK